MQTVCWSHAHSGVEEYRTSNSVSGAGILIAIVDTGCDSDHPDLVDNIEVADEDDHGHGTFCAGVACAGNNGIGVIGVAPDARLICTKVMDKNGLGMPDRIADGVRRAVELGADIISISIGYRGPDPSELISAVADAIGARCLVVAASGNDAQADATVPASLPGVISVGSIGPDGSKAGFSAGEHVTVLAPGVDVTSTWIGGGYATDSGTSFACPFVAGVLALMLEKHRRVENPSTPLVDAVTAAEHVSRLSADGRINLTICEEEA